MSRIKRNVEIFPTEIEPTGEELLISVGHRCPACAGRGYIWRDADENNHEDYKEKCKFCNGTGELDAIIKIEWQPHKI